MLRLFYILLIVSTPFSSALRNSATLCSSTEFLCLDGNGCVSQEHLCDGGNHCSDGSDLAYCALQSYHKSRNHPAPTTENNCGKRRSQCSDGTCIRSNLWCDGVADCSDSSDESFVSCSDRPCPETWLQCAYGACMERDRFCNGEKDCVDGSDENDAICKRSFVEQSCRLPPYPRNGFYTAASEVYLKNKWDFQELTLNVTCNTGYDPIGRQNIICFNGLWSDEMPECVRQCEIVNQESVNYNCVESNNGRLEIRPCRDFEPSGTIVIPRCMTPDYYSEEIIRPMTCSNGKWDHNATCKPECGIFSPEPSNLVQKGNAPWHVAVYKRLGYQQCCGGSIISPKIVISAAQCFWDHVAGLLPAPAFMVAAGKIHPQWDYIHDTHAQRSDVNDIQIPNLFMGKLKHWQHNIAIVRVLTPFVYNAYIRPICLNFDFDISVDKFIENNTYGKIAAWNGGEFLEVLDLSYKPNKDCIKESNNLREFMTFDKFCASSPKDVNIASVTGAGLVFPNKVGGATRYFLQGVASTGGTDMTLLFTHIIKYQNFILKYINLE